MSTFAREGAAEALIDIEELSAWRPGLGLERDPAPHLAALGEVAERLPDNLTVRLALAEALVQTGDAQAARTMATQLIRAARPAGPVRTPSPQGAERLQDARLAGQFFHSVDLGDVFIEGAPKNAIVTARETLQCHWPDLVGKTVLDIGTFNGWFAFEAERRGAAQVTANDYYSWMVDLPLVWRWVCEQQALGLRPDPYGAPFPINDPQGQPGRKIFDLAREAMGSGVSPLFGRIETVEVKPHDIVLLLGVLYHTDDPLGLLRRAYDLTKEVLILETLSFEYPANLSAPIWHFYPPGDPKRDQSTVWAPSSIGLQEALLKVGFRKVELLYGWDGSGFYADWPTLEARLWVHAYR